MQRKEIKKKGAGHSGRPPSVVHGVQVDIYDSECIPQFIQVEIKLNKP
jgi:hypothetical protein